MGSSAKWHAIRANPGTLLFEHAEHAILLVCSLAAQVRLMQVSAQKADWKSASLVKRHDFPLRLTPSSA